MNALIVYAHPEPKSFNAAMLGCAVKVIEAQGHSIEVSDLYAQGFNPVSDARNFTSLSNPGHFKQQNEERHASQTNGFAPDVQAEMDKLERADLLIFQFPLWWFGVPAILKGWVDRVFAVGFAYGGGQWFDNGMFRGRRAMLSLTVGGPQTMYSATGLNGDINDVLFPIQHGMFAFVGFDVLPPFIAWRAPYCSDAERSEILDRYAQHLRDWQTMPPLPFRKLEEYDETYQLKVSSQASNRKSTS